MSDEEPKTRRWGTLDQAAKHLAVSNKTVRRMIARDEVFARKFGGSVRVDMNTLDESGQPVE
jgi:excisionase family DNA binding protein